MKCAHKIKFLSIWSAWNVLPNIKWWWDAECKLVRWRRLGVDDGAEAREIYIWKKWSSSKLFTQHNIYHLVDAPTAETFCLSITMGFSLAAPAETWNFQNHIHTQSRESAPGSGALIARKLGTSLQFLFFLHTNTMVNGKIKFKTRYRWESLTETAGKLYCIYFPFPERQTLSALSHM